MNSSPQLNYQQSTNFLENLKSKPEWQKTRHQPQITITRFKKLLKILNNPQQTKTKYIHIAGSSGKGSTALYLGQILSKAGYKTGIYTSPHPTHCYQRIQIGSKYISQKTFSDLTSQKLSPAINQLLLKTGQVSSYFENMLALAFLYFQTKQTDYTILEAGCGGRYDATNIIKKPTLTIITNISKDHTHILGNTIKQITTAKAGIIKPGCHLITGAHQKQAKEIISKICQQNQATVTYLKQSKTPVSSNQQLVTQAATFLKIPQSLIKPALAKTKLPCRLEQIQTKPTIILDGAHNPAKITNLQQHLKNLTYKELHLILSLSQGKQAHQILKILLEIPIKIIYLTEHLNHHRPAISALKLQQTIKKIKPEQITKINLNPYATWKIFKDNLPSADLGLVTGSFYLAGLFRELNN